MLVLNKGEYLGTVSSTGSADGVVIGTTEYYSTEGTSSLHYHENPHLSFVLKGSMGVKRKNWKGSTQALESFSYMRSGEVHQNFIQTGYCKNMNLELEPEFFAKYAINEDNLSPDLFKDRPGAALLMVRLYKELTVADENLADSVHMLLLNASNLWKKDGYLFPSWVDTVRELLNDKWNDQVSLSELAAAAGVHPVTISKYFTRYFGTSFGEYRRRLKIERAIQLIIVGRIPLTEIGYTCGFFDQSHFIRSFRDCTNMLPKDFRKV